MGSGIGHGGARLKQDYQGTGNEMKMVVVVKIFDAGYFDCDGEYEDGGGCHIIINIIYDD